MTASLALSIISMLGVTVAFFEFLKGIVHIRQSYDYYDHYHYDYNATESGRVVVPWRKQHMVCFVAVVIVVIPDHCYLDQLLLELRNLLHHNLF